MEFGGESEGLTLVLPEEQMLVATVLGEPSSKGIPVLRTSHVCAGLRDVVVRSVDGRFVWSERHGAAGATWHEDGTADILPDDWRGEVQAMVSGLRLIEWLVADSYEVTAHALQGESSKYGHFGAELHPDYGFVLSVIVGDVGMRRMILKTISFRVVGLDPALLSPEDIDPGRLI